MSTDEHKTVLSIVAKDDTKDAFNEIKQGARDTAQVVAKAGQEAANGIAKIGAGSEQAAQKLDGSARSIISSIQRTTAAIEAGEKGSSKYFEAIARQRGVGGDVLEPYLAQLRAAERAQATASQGMVNMGVSAAQTAAALRQVPAQFTDIVVSLQGGQAPLTVLLQQGGQLKDMFGGTAEAAKALSGYVVSLVSPFTVAAAAAAALAVAYNQGSQENDAFIRSIVLTGNASGVTASQLREYAREIDSVVGTQAQAASGLADFVAAGVRGGEELRRYTQTAIEWEKLTGQAVEKTAQQFADLQKDPLAAVVKLNEGTNFLTVSVYEQIQALEDQGRKADASKVAMDALDGAMRDRSKTIRESLGYIERGWSFIKSAAAEAWDAMLNVGRAATLNDQINAKQAELERKLTEPLAVDNAAMRASREKGIEILRKEIWALYEKADAEKVAALASQEAASRMEARIAFDKDYAKALEKETTLQEKLTKARNEGERAGKTESEMKAVLAWVTEEHNKANKGSAAAARAAKKELADQAKVYADLAGLSSTYYADLARGQKELAKGLMTQAQYVKYVEDLIKKQPFAIALAKEEEKARRELQKAIEDDIKQADRVADKRQAAIKSVEDALLKARQEEEAHALAAAANITLAEAMERLTIARLEDHLAQARAGAESQATIDALERELRARKELQTVLQQKGVREANKKATEEAAKDWDKTAQTISRTLSDYIMAGGKNAAQYLKRLFATLVLEPIVQTAVGSVLGVSKTAIAGSGSGSNVLDLLNGGKTATNAVTGGGMFMNGMSAWGSGGSVTGVLSNPGLYSGMELLGAASPILLGGALLAGLLTGDLFGSRGANHAGAAYSTAGLGNDKSAEALFGRAAGDWYDDLTQRYSSGLEKQLGTSVDALSGVYKSLAKYAGDSAKQIDIVAGFASNPKHGDEDSYGYFKLIDKITGEALKDYTARDGVLGTDPQAAYTKFVGEMGGALIEQLKAADIPGWMRSIFDGLGSDITVDGLNKALQAIAAVDLAFNGWADTLKGFSGLSAEVQTALLNTSGGLDALAGNVNAFYGSFYSEQERMGILQRQVLQQLAGLGVTVDTSTAEAAKESFRKTVEGALDAGNAELAAKLLAMSGSFATAADYAAKAAEDAAKVAEDAASKTAAAAEEAARALAELRKQAAGIVQSQQQSLDSLIAGLQRKAEQANGGYVGSLWLSGAEFTQFSSFADQLDGATAALAQLQALGLGDELAGYADQIGAIVQQTKEALSGALSSQRLMAGDAAGALAAAVSASMPQYADFTLGGQFQAGAFNAASAAQRAKAASGLISDASANALSIPGIAGVLGGLVGEIATYSRDVVLRDLRVQGAESLGPAVSGMLTGVYERLADAAQAQMISGPGLAGVMSARMQYGGAAADVQAFGQAVEAVRGALDEGRISAVEADKALAYLNGAFGDLAPLLSDVAGQTARAAAAAVDLRNAGVASVEYYFGSLAGVVSKMDAAAAAANSPLAQTADVIGLLDSTATAFGQSASAALEGAQAAITGYLDAAAMAREQGAWSDSWAYSSRAADAQLALSGLTAADSRVSRAQLIADAAATASGIMTTASAAKAAQELAGKLVLGEGQSMRDLSLLVSGVGQYDNAGFYDAFARISDALGSGSISNEQYSTLFDYALGTYQGVSEEAKATATAFERLRDSMRSFADALLIGDKTTLSPEATLAEMQRQYAEAFSAAAGGDTEAISKYQSLANGLLDKSLYSTKAEYNVAFGRTYGDARALESQGVNVLAQQQNGVVTELKALNASLTRRVGDLERILAQIAKNTAETSRGVEGIALGT